MTDEKIVAQYLLSLTQATEDPRPGPNRAVHADHLRSLLADHADLKELLELQPRCTYTSASGQRGCDDYATKVDKRCSPEWRCDMHSAPGFTELATAGFVRRLTS